MRMTKQVVSFNRHFFALAAVAAAVGAGVMVATERRDVQVAMACGIGLAAYFAVASVIASYVAYDASDLYRLCWWPRRCLPHDPRAAVVVHAGFDAASPAIRQRFPTADVRVLDFYDDAVTTEASIRRAHRLSPPSSGDETISTDAWPVASATQDVVFALNAAHELRESGQRERFFREAKRVLRPGGRVVVIEQLRNAINFAAFGVAAFHFLSRWTWLSSFRAARLTVTDEFAISPFLRAFVLQ